MPALNVSLVQADLHWHDASANRRMFSEILSPLAGLTDVVVLPEMFTTGFSMHASELAEPMDGPSVSWLKEQAARCNAAVCGSIIVGRDGNFFNRFLFARPDGRIDCYDKRHLFRLASEEQHYKAGSERVIIEYLGFRLCPQVCYDLRFPVWSRNRDDYDCLIYVANWPAPRHFAWQTLIRARAIENLSYVVAVNRSGKDGNDLPYEGGSAVVNYLGSDLVDLGNRPGTATVALDLEELRRFREKFAFHRDADAFVIDSSS